MALSVNSTSKKMKSVLASSVKSTGPVDAAKFTQITPAPTNGGTGLDANITLTAAEVDSGLWYGTIISATRDLILPTAALLYAYLNDRDRYAVGRTLDLAVQNNAATDLPLVVTKGTGGTEVGNMVVEAYVAANLNAGAGLFRIRMDSPTAYTVYRMA